MKLIRNQLEEVKYHRKDERKRKKKKRWYDIGMMINGCRKEM